MATLTFQTLSFKEKGDNVEVTLLKHFSTLIPNEDLSKIAEFKIVNPHTIEFTKIEEEKALKKFMFLFEKYLDNLKTKLTGNHATYIHQNSNIPLIGNPAFGIVYRGSSIIEVKPVTSCNLDCIYCSVGEGLSSKKNDFVIEEDYLIQELDKLINFIGDTVEIHIGVQGEPFFYGAMEEFLEHLQKDKRIYRISIDTNGTLLSKEKIDRLAKFDKLQLNFSLDAINEELAKKIAGTKVYHLKHILEMIRYSAEKNIKIIIAPVILQGYNEQEIDGIIEFAKSLPKLPKLGIQNFLPYKTGRIPAKVTPWPKFYLFLDKLGKKHNINLRLTEVDFGIKETKELPKPFSIGDEVTAVIKCPDRYPNTSVAVAKNRMISIPDCKFKKDKKIKVKITKNKHNIYSGKLV
ncbi:MAG: radical SAM protein [Candidatus Woesearchaeota archaeon]